MGFSVTYQQWKEAQKESQEEIAFLRKQVDELKAENASLAEAVRVLDTALKQVEIDMDRDDDVGSCSHEYIREAIKSTPASLRGIAEAREKVIAIARTLCAGNVRFDEAWGRYLAAKKAQEKPEGGEKCQGIKRGLRCSPCVAAARECGEKSHEQN